MTKDEAVAAIGQAMGFPLWQSSGNKIRKILDQIDQPQEFTVRELVELLGLAGKSVVSIDHNGDWALQVSATYASHGYTIDSLKSTLTKLATTQPSSDKVTVQIDRKLAEFIADYRDGDLSVACREALKAPST
jgi:hypothetical protein